MTRRVATLAVLAGLGATLTACAGGGGAGTGASAEARSGAPASVGVAIRNFSFTQQTLTVAAGTTVTWTNRDSSVHTVTANDRSFDSGHLAQGGSFRHTFRAPGTYGYHCDIHQYMTGSVVVTG